MNETQEYELHGVTITMQQERALRKIYQRDVTVAPMYSVFRRRAQMSFGHCVMVPWKGMVIGIETDGYSHT